MTAAFDFDQRLLEALEEGPLDPQPASVDLALARARATTQRRPRISMLDRLAWPMPERSRRVQTATRRLVLLAAAALLVLAAAGALVGAARLVVVPPRPFGGSTQLAVVATGESHCWSIQRVDVVAEGTSPLVDCAEWASLDAKGRWASWRNLDPAKTSTILEMVDLRSGARREVTRANGRGILPGPFSPGGRYLAWDWCTTVTFPAECEGTAIADLSHSPPTIVDLPLGSSGPVWAPDDSSLAVDGNEGDLSIANGDGSGLHDAGRGSFLAWSPDGERFAMLTDNGIEIRSRDGNGLTTFPVKSGSSASAAWSPDGRMLAVRRADSFGLGSGVARASAEMWLIGLSGQGRQQISLGPGCVELPERSGPEQTPEMDCRGVVQPAGGYYPVWSPDSQRIAFGLEPGGTGNALVGVAIVDVQTGNVTRLDDGGTPAWSPDGRQLMFATTEGVDVADADGTHRQQVLDSPGSIDSKWGAWIPDEAP